MKIDTKLELKLTLELLDQNFSNSLPILYLKAFFTHYNRYPTLKEVELYLEAKNASPLMLLVDYQKSFITFINDDCNVYKTIANTTNIKNKVTLPDLLKHYDRSPVAPMSSVVWLIAEDEIHFCWSSHTGKIITIEQCI